MDNCQEKVAALKEQVEQYEEMLQKTLEEKKSIYKVVAGPLDVEGTKFYRVNSGSDANGLLVSMWEESPFGIDMSKDLESGTEVIVVGSAIISVIPESLEIKKEKVEFNLIEWDQIGGLKSQVDNIREAIELPLNNQKLAQELGLGDFKGLLLYGPPGCGKTLIAKAIASTILKATKVDPESFVYIKGAELLSSYVGQTEQSIARIFHNARNFSKKSGQRAVVFIDEAEALMPVRGSMRSSDVDKTIVPTFLSEMDGLDKEHNPIMILSTNLPNALDPAITREGRIELKIGINRPTEADSKEIFEIHLKKVKLADKLEDLILHGSKSVFTCDMKSNISGAMIETVVQSAARKALTRYVSNTKSQKGVTLADLEESIKLINSNYVKV